jgi:hypothetical protein
MPLHELAVSPADVSGAALRLVLNGPPPAPLATCRLTTPTAGCWSSVCSAHRMSLPSSTLI